MKTKLSTLLLVIFCFGQSVMAQDYAEYAKKVREEVWAWDMPEFRNYTVPEEYKNESAVILAKHDQILATGKSRFRVSMDLAFTINKELLYTHTERQLVKINDKVSLEKYSSLSFKEQKKQWGYFMSSKFKTIVGVRIIKPDGMIKEVDVEEEAVDMTEGKKEKVDHKRLAVSDLQVGDILDWFVQEEGHVDRQNIPPLDFVFGNEYPMLSYSVYCEIGRKLTVETLAVNGAPDFEVSSNEEKDVVLKVEKKNIPKIEGYNRWVSPYREFPLLRMSVLNNASKSIWKPKTARKSGLHRNLPSSTILDDAKCAFGGYVKGGLISTSVYKETKKLVDTYKKENKTATNEELAAYIYDALQYSWEYGSYYSKAESFIEVLNYFLKYYKIDFKLAFVTSKYGAPMDALANRYDVYYFTLANDNKQIFTFDPPFSLAGEVDPDFEGETAHTLSDYKDKGGILKGVEGQFTVPLSDEKTNLSITEIEVSFTDDPLVLDIKRVTRNKGNTKRSFQRSFATVEKWQEEARAHLGIKISALEEMEKKRSSRKYVEDYQSKLEKDREDLKEKFKDEIKGYHDAAPKKLVEGVVEHLGISAEHPDFVSMVHYEQEGMVQKAGNNYILNVGKLIGSQLELKGDDRKRNMNVYMPTARSYEYQISIQIPEGYVIENIADLNMQVDNGSGSFHSFARLDGKTLTVNTRKVYKSAFVPLENWNDLLKMLDKTVEFCAKSVVLKKL